MKALDQLAKSAAPQVPMPANGPMPFNHAHEEVTDADFDAPIEPPPVTTRRTLKARLQRRGPSQPIPITDPQS